MNEEKDFDGLNESWEAGKTPSWFSEYALQLINSYKLKKEELPMNNGCQHNDFHTLMMDFQFELGCQWEQCWSEFEFDLKSVQKHLEKGLYHFEQLPVDCCDERMRDDTTFAKSQLTQTKQKYAELSARLNNDDPRECVEICIKLGVSSANKALRDNLEKCSANDREVFMQQIRCVQLLQLLETLEEEEIVQQYQSTTTNPKLAAVLKKAQKLATTNTRLPNKTDMDGAVREPQLYGVKKENIGGLICSELRNYQTIEQVIIKIEQDFKLKLGYLDLEFVTNKFKKECIKMCKEDILLHVENFIKDHDVSSVLKQFDLLGKITTLNNVPLTDFKLNFYITELIDSKLITEREANELVDHFKIEFIDYSIFYSDSIKKELMFINSLVTFLCDSYDLNKTFKQLGINIVKKFIPSVKDLLSNIANMKNEEYRATFSALQATVKNMMDQQHFFCEQQILKSIQDFLVPVEIRETDTDGQTLVVVLGNHVVLSNVLSDVEQRLNEKKSIEEVHFICRRAFHIDSNLKNAIWHGKNISVRAQLVKVHDTVIWNVSGEDKTHDYQKQVGNIYGVGKAGSDGFSGESGGNIAIYVEQIEQHKGWTIISNGGCGSNGQDGSDGLNGIDGVSITQSELESDFKSPVRFLAYPSQRFNFYKKMVTAIKNCATIKVNQVKFPNIYIEAKTEQGNEIVFCYTGSSATTRFQCYFLYKGSPGTSGNPGGAGGEGGQGGYAGQIVVKNLKNNSKIDIYKEANRGKDGIPGFGGFFGKHGKNGWDIGYLDFQNWKDIQYYGKDQDNKLTIDYEFNSLPNNVWCWKNERYVRFGVGSVYHKQISHKQRTSERRERQNHARATMKKAIVEGSFLSNYAQHFTATEGDALINVFSQIEELQRLALEASQQQKKQEEIVSKQMKVRHLISATQLKETSKEPSCTISDIFDRRSRNIENKIKNLKPTHTNQEDWLLITKVPLTREELKAVITTFNIMKENMNQFTKDLSLIEQAIVKKYRLATLEEIAEKLSKADKRTISVPNMSPIYATSCLVENPTEADLATHSIEELGSLKMCLSNYDSKDQRDKLSKYCWNDRTECVKDCIKSFIEEAYDFDQVAYYIKDYSKQCRFFKHQQQRELDKFFNDCFRNKLLDNYQKVLYMWRQENPVGPLLEQEILENLELNDIYKRYRKIKSKQFNFGSFLTDVNIYSEFLNLVAKKGPALRSYRELLARAFGVNIRVYVRNTDGKLVLKDIHSGSNARDIINLLSVEGHFSEIYIDIEHLKLLEERRDKTDQLFKKINIVYALKQVHLLDEFLNNQNVHYFNESNRLQENGLTSYSIEDVIYKITRFLADKDQKSFQQLLKLVSTLGMEYQKILHSICYRFSYEGKQISTEELRFMINCLISQTNDSDSMTKLCLWIVMAYHQHKWVRELILLQLENYFKSQLWNEKKWRKYLNDVTNKGILILLSSKLDNCRPGNFVSVDRLDETLHMLSLVKIKIEDLLTLELSEWFYTLEETFCKQRLKNMVTWQDSIDEKPNYDKLHELSYYAVALINNYSFELTRDFFNILEKKTSREETCKADLVDIFCKIYNGKWNLSKSELLSLGKCESLHQWKNNMESKFEGDSVRDISMLVKLMTGNQNASKAILEIVPDIEACVKKINARKNVAQFSTSNGNNMKILNKFSKFLQKDDEIQDKQISSLASLLEKIDDVIFKYKMYRLRDTQKLAILTLLGNHENKTLVQVATGEGKTLIVVAVAIIKALRNEKVDIITSSSVLAKRDSESNTDIYKEFKINVSHNCSEDIEKRKEAYAHNHVIYGDLASFQRDYLLHTFYQKYDLGHQCFQNVIVDEVDCMLLDRGNNMLYLSHDLPDMDKLEVVYLSIWNIINKFENFDNESIKHAILWNIYGIIRLSDIGRIDLELDNATKIVIWEALITTKLINEKGFLMSKTVCRETLSKNLGSDLSDYVDRLVFFVNEYIHREQRFDIPNYMKPFVETHLDSWIEAAKKAHCMEVGQDYVVDVDRSGNSGDRNPNIIILDRNTGTDMINSQWEAALHQFIQLKHGCKISLQSLKAVFVSNVEYFKKYQHLYGLTGTLGSQRERDLLGKLYKVHFANIPTAKCKLFYEDLPKICKTQSEWIDAINQSVEYVTITQKRSLLIICDTLNEVTTLRNALSQKCKCPIRTYTRDYEKFDDGEVPPQQVIIATNLAGRGTDIKITPKLRSAGGLHICLTYLPSNVRIEQQAFGRAARSGDRGSGQLIIVSTGQISTNSSRMLHLKQERDSAELKRISNIREYYETQIVKEEKWFEKFKEVYKHLEESLKKSELTKNNEQLRQILLESCLDRWAFWLDENCQNTKLTDSENELFCFLRKLKKLGCTTIPELRDWVINSPPQMVKLGRCLIQIDNAEDLIVFFDKIILSEPNFSEAAHYYKACVISRQINGEEHLQKLLIHELETAAALFEHRKLILKINVSLVEEHKLKDRFNITQINSYKEQKDIVCNFYDALIQSIHNIIGHPVNPESFIDSFYVNETQSHDVYDKLIGHDILSKPTITRNAYDQELRRLNNNYGLSANKLENYIKNYRAKQGDSLNISKFTAKLKEHIKIPSKEEFWKYLVKQGILLNESKFVIIDKEKHKEFTAMCEKLPGNEPIKNEILRGLREVLIYPFIDLQNNKLIFEKTQFKIVLGTKYKIYKQRGAFIKQRKALLNQNNKKNKFLKYDSITVNDFDRINVSKQDAQVILDHLVETEVLQAEGHDMYTLKIIGSEIKHIQLKAGWKIYEGAVKDLLNLCFSFRIAFESMYKQSAEECDNLLMMKPYRALTAELLTSNMVRPVKVCKMVEQEIFSILLKGHKSTDGLSVFEINSVLSTLKNLKGNLGPLKPAFVRTAVVDKEDWNLFSLNGLDMVVRVDNLSWFQVAFTFIKGVFEIGVGLLVQIFDRTESFRKMGLRMIVDGVTNIFESIYMAADVILSNYNRSGLFSTLLRAMILRAKYFVDFNFKITRFGQSVIRALLTSKQADRTRKITQVVAHTLGIAQENLKNESMIRNQLKTFCMRLQDQILHHIEGHIGFEVVAKNIEQAFHCMESSQATAELQNIFESAAKRQNYVEDFQIILQKIAKSTMKVIEDATRINGAKKVNPNAVFDTLINSDEVLFTKHRSRISDHVKKMIVDLEAQSADLVNKKETHSSQYQPNFKTLQENLIRLWKNILLKHMQSAVEEHLVGPVMERCGSKLIRYFIRQNEHELDFDLKEESTSNFNKMLRAEKLRKELKSHSHKQVSEIGNLLDIQYNDGLKKREKTNSSLKLLAKKIRFGEPIEACHLDICLDAIRFVLLHQGVVISNITIITSENDKLQRIYSSPRCINGMKNKLNIKNGKFQICPPGDTSYETRNCLYDVLKKNIFELRTINPKYLEIDLCHYFMQLSVKESLPDSNDVFHFSQSWYFEKVCFAKFMEGCLQCPENASTLYNSLLERANANFKAVQVRLENDLLKRANVNEWHGRLERNVVIVDKRFSKFVTSKNMTTDHLKDNAMVALEDAFSRFFVIDAFNFQNLMFK